MHGASWFQAKNKCGVRREQSSPENVTKKSRIPHATSVLWQSSSSTSPGGVPLLWCSMSSTSYHQHSEGFWVTFCVDDVFKNEASDVKSERNRDDILVYGV